MFHKFTNLKDKQSCSVQVTFMCLVDLILTTSLENRFLMHNSDKESEYQGKVCGFFFEQVLSSLTNIQNPLPLLSVFVAALWPNSHNSIRYIWSHSAEEEETTFQIGQSVSPKAIYWILRPFLCVYPGHAWNYSYSLFFQPQAIGMEKCFKFS